MITCVALVGINPTQSLIQGISFFYGDDAWDLADKRQEEEAAKEGREDWQWFQLQIAKKEEE